MNRSIVYDKAGYHTGGEWPQDLEHYQSFVHTGLFLGWLIDRDLLSEEYRANSKKEIEAFEQRKMTGPQIYQDNDGVLIDDMLNKEGNAFTQFYFDFQKGQFVKDYNEILAVGLPSEFHVQDTWQNYETLKARIDNRYEDWKRKTLRKWLLNRWESYRNFLRS